MKTEMATKAASVRVGSTFSLPRVIQSLGHSPELVFAAAGIDLELYSHPENRITVVDLGMLLAGAARTTERADIGLLAVSDFQPPNLGLVGEIAARGPDIDAAMTSIVRLLRYNTLAGYPTLSVVGATSMAKFELRYSDFPGANFILDGATGILFRFMQWLCGPGWKPEAVHLSRRNPSDPRPFQVFFRAPIRFSATEDGILFSSDWLKRPVEHGAKLHASSQLELGSTPFSELVRRQAAMDLGLGEISAEEMAHRLGFSRRQLFRLLKAEGTTCQELTDDARFSRARHLLAAGEAPLAEIAFALGYPDQSSFTRAFVRWSGMPPGAWRNATRKALPKQ